MLLTAVVTGLVASIVLGLGLLFGFLLGKASVFIVNRINLDTAGLYPVLVLMLGLVTFGVTTFAGGSGFLAVYIAGIIIGNEAVVFQRGMFVFHDGIAWISQITMFGVLGLLSFPSALIREAWTRLAVAGALMFLARPLAVFVSLFPFKFSLRELSLISWVGLKGAVPIILATYPLLFGVPEGLLYFNVIFFVVLVSALTQGWTLPAAARALQLDQQIGPEPPVSLDITSIRQVNAEIVDYEILERTAAAHSRISELGLPEDVVIAMVARNHDIIPARGPTVLLPGDHVFVIMWPRSGAGEGTSGKEYCAGRSPAFRNFARGMLIYLLGFQCLTSRTNEPFYPCAAEFMCV